MTEEQIKLVQMTWKQVEPIAKTAAELFYGRLFELDPALRPLFKSNIEEQGRKLMHMIGVAVRGLSKLDEIVPAVQAMGQRHAGYGVKDEHYDTVAAALLWTLEKGLQDAFTPAVKEAWTTAYVLLATTMKDAARTVPAGT